MPHETHLWCPVCFDHTDHVSVTCAAQIAGVTNRTIYFWVLRDTLHVNRAAGEQLQICHQSLQPLIKLVVKQDGEYSIDARIQLVINLVDQQYQRDDPTLSKMAKHVHLSIWYFARLFKKNTGSHFSEYLRNLRLEKAEKLLENPVLSIKEVAAAVGYKHVSDFDHHFKSTYGIPPGEYRRFQQTSEEITISPNE
jgi:AraC-like DNA-binding protein